MKFFYEDRMKEVSTSLDIAIENNGDINIVLMGGIITALYDIANELHELNQAIRNK